MVGHHDQSEEVDYGLVLAVGGGVHRHLCVQILQLLVHGADASSAECAAKEVELMQQQVLGHHFLGRHVAHTYQGQQFVGFPGGQ